MKENRLTFVNRLIPHFSPEDVALIMFAYDLSKEAHRTQQRAQGERYFEHPRAGCIILMDEFEVYDRDLLIAFLLHDVGEDTPLFGNVTEGWTSFIGTARFRITRIFNERIADTVIRLTKPYVTPKTAPFTDKATMMNHYLNELVMNEDAVVLKAIDRLHNLRTIPGHKQGWAAKQVIETEEVLIPVFVQATGTHALLIDRILGKIRAQIVEIKQIEEHALSTVK
jgi:(p)ppGpp synthase/HD superfamily hydrolase